MRQLKHQKGFIHNTKHMPSSVNLTSVYPDILRRIDLCVFFILHTEHEQNNFEKLLDTRS